MFGWSFKAVELHTNSAPKTQSTFFSFTFQFLDHQTDGLTLSARNVTFRGDFQVTVFLVVSSRFVISYRSTEELQAPLFRATY